jgi:hypothetical protein
MSNIINEKHLFDDKFLLKMIKNLPDNKKTGLITLLGGGVTDTTKSIKHDGGGIFGDLFGKSTEQLEAEKEQTQLAQYLEVIAEKEVVREKKAKAEAAQRATNLGIFTEQEFIKEKQVKAEAAYRAKHLVRSLEKQLVKANESLKIEQGIESNLLNKKDAASLDTQDDINKLINPQLSKIQEKLKQTQGTIYHLTYALVEAKTNAEKAATQAAAAATHAAADAAAATQAAADAATQAAADAATQAAAAATQAAADAAKPSEEQAELYKKTTADVQADTQVANANKKTLKLLDNVDDIKKNDLTKLFASLGLGTLIITGTTIATKGYLLNKEKTSKENIVKILKDKVTNIFTNKDPQGMAIIGTFMASAALSLGTLGKIGFDKYIKKDSTQIKTGGNDEMYKAKYIKYKAKYLNLVKNN